MRRLPMALALIAAASTASASRAAAQADVYPDETYAFYSTENPRVEQAGSTRTTTWQLEAAFRAFAADADFAPNSILRWELRQGERRIAGARCRSRITWLRTRTPAQMQRRILTANQCQDDETNIRETGELTVAWFFVNGQTDEEREIARHTIVVRELPVVDRALPPTPNAPHMIIDRHGEVFSSFLVEDPYEGGVGFDGYFERLAPRGNDESHIFLMFNASPSDGNSGLQQAVLRCRRDGQPVALASDRLIQHATREESDNAWLAVPGATTIAESAREERVWFRRYSVLLPLTFGQPGDGGRYADDRTIVQPGQWECDLRNSEALTLRTFRFVVGADGHIAPHAEESEGGLRLGPGIHLVETVIPAAEHPLDGRTDPAALARALHGRGFRTAAGRALAVPAIGEPAPVAARSGARASGGRASGGRGGRSR